MICFDKSCRALVLEGPKAFCTLSKALITSRGEQIVNISGPAYKLPIRDDSTCAIISKAAATLINNVYRGVLNAGKCACGRC